MNPINAFKKWLLNILVPYIEGMPYLEGTNKKKKDLSQEPRFRDLFKKRKKCLNRWGPSSLFNSIWDW